MRVAVLSFMMIFAFCRFEVPLKRNILGKYYIYGEIYDESFSFLIEMNKKISTVKSPIDPSQNQANKLVLYGHRKKLNL